MSFRFGTGPSAVLFALFCVATFPGVAVAQTPSSSAQTPSQPVPQPAPAATLPAAPTATPAPAGSLPSMPAGTAPQTQAPVQAFPSAVPQQTPPPAYVDPLQQPIVVEPAPSGPAVPQVRAVEIAQPSVASSLPSVGPYDFPTNGKVHIPSDALGSTYIPVDSWIYPAALRLYSLGYLNSSFITMRPWTRRSLLHALQASQAYVVADNNQQALEIFTRLQAAVADETPATGPNGRVIPRGLVYGPETVFTRALGIAGPTLRDSYHLGQTFVNDYGRPYQAGFNDITGFSTVNEWGRFSLYVRGEYQHSPSGPGYSQTLAGELASIDGVPYSPTIPQATIPSGTIAAANPFRLDEAVLSFHLLGHEISGGKSDDWYGPDLGGGMAWSNNAENIYSFRINRVEPLHIPLLSWALGPVRYDFFVGSLKGHTYPNSPWVHSEGFEFHPTSNFQFGFERTVIWGGHGPGIDDPITIHTFLKSFFSFDDTGSNPQVKGHVGDPGARYAAFNFAWRLPFLSHFLTLYTDSICHDDVTPISAPRRAAYRPGIYLSQFPHLPRLDLRVEAASTDTSTLRSMEGQFNYYEIVQRQGYTNKGFIMGDWIGREAKGGQAWLTYHLSGSEWVQLEYLNKKSPKDFIPGGTTQNQMKVEVLKNLRKDLQLDAWLQYERWKAPVPLISGNNPLQVSGGPLYYANAQSDTAVAVQLTWYPKLRTRDSLTGK